MNPVKWKKSHKPHILILDEACGIFLFLGIGDIYKPAQACIYTGDENKGYPKGSIPLALGFQ